MTCVGCGVGGVFGLAVGRVAKRKQETCVFAAALAFCTLNGTLPDKHTHSHHIHGINNTAGLCRIWV
jgi:hypothetical protein